MSPFRGIHSEEVHLSPYDRVLSTRLGAAAAQLILKEEYGYMVGMINGNDTEKFRLPRWQAN